MRYSSYIQECVKDLETSREYETDMTLVFLVRTQHLTERISEQVSRDKAPEDMHGIPTAPTSAYIHAFQNELDHIRKNLSPNLRTDCTLWPGVEMLGSC